MLINFRLAVSLAETGYSHVTSRGWVWLGAGSLWGGFGELRAAEATPVSSRPPEATAFPRPRPLPGLGLLLRTAQNRLFCLLSGEVGREACIVVEGRSLHSRCLILFPTARPINIRKRYDYLEGDGIGPESNH